MQTSNATQKVRSAGRGQVAVVVNTIGKRISTGLYREGETLPIEQELANSLGVGRNALREAVGVKDNRSLYY